MAVVIGLDRLSILPGDVENVSYAGFTSTLSGSADFYLQERSATILKHIVYSGGGSGSTNVTIPASTPPGVYHLVGRDAQGNMGASQAFQVINVNQALAATLLVISPSNNGPQLAAGQFFTASGNASAPSSNTATGRFRLRAVYKGVTAVSVGQSMAPGTSAVFSCLPQLVADPTVRSIQYFLEQVDPNGNPLRTVDQRSQTALQIVTPLPDGAIDASQSNIPDTAISGQTFQCRVLVKNVGLASGQFRLTPYVNDSPWTTPLGSFALGVGQQQSFLLNINLTQTASVSFLLENFNPSTNRWQLTDLWPNPSKIVTITAAGPKAHIASFTGSISGTAGQKAPVAPVLENSGTSAGQFRISLRDSPTSAPIGSTAERTLGVNAADTFSLTITLPSTPGTTNYVVTAEHKNPQNGQWIVDDSKALSVTVEQGPPPNGTLSLIPAKTAFASGEPVVINGSWTVNGFGAAGNFNAQLVLPPNSTLDSKNGSFPSTGQFQVVFTAQNFVTDTPVIATVAVGNASKSVSVTVKGNNNPPPPPPTETLDVTPTKTSYLPSEAVEADGVYKSNGNGTQIAWTASLALGGAAPLQNKTGTSAADGTFHVSFDPMTFVDKDTNAAIKVVAGNQSITKNVLISPTGNPFPIGLPDLTPETWAVLIAAGLGVSYYWYEYGGGKKVLAGRGGGGGGAGGSPRAEAPVSRF